jgi:hypothetical protein
MIGDHYRDKWNVPPYQGYLSQAVEGTTTNLFSLITRPEFESLKKEVEEMKALLIKAKIYDEKNNEPNCEMEDKISTLKKMAELMGVSLDEVFK